MCFAKMVKIPSFAIITGWGAVCLLQFPIQLNERLYSVSSRQTVSVITSSCARLVFCDSEQYLKYTTNVIVTTCITITFVISTFRIYFKKYLYYLNCVYVHVSIDHLTPGTYDLPIAKADKKARPTSVSVHLQLNFCSYNMCIMLLE